MKKLQEILKNRPFNYEVIRHERPLLSAKDGADYFGIEIGQTAPTLILKTNKGFFAFIISGAHEKVDFEEMSDVLECSSVKLASRKEVKKVTGYEVGSVPMIGLDLPCLIDKQLFKYDFIYGGIGYNDYTLKIEPRALKELNEDIKLLDF
ncbi:aminoacyl-tRNA deacylase [Pseudogracilibacillus auburnensis]|uniref:Prolyl-tRNA editing enzyme YbaK/EbsC (Cys-tRNA(Pro) deacylase) n=1 Tax=Pseudogracilibacillus auburnensis TaxID=1494959 RepID=A0A2V3VXQ4_9BACI|nr:YbaK/EbsC family protein [Pseudogracilibacillus auburnensis]PXW84835.1 prolyl-tRNA editing enzyme YbaK/EbsC (Cys-tRNA(Pro) deacylase) [Pseudogracilibacillus auburnensis]